MFLEKIKTYGLSDSGNYIFEGDNKDSLEILRCTHKSSIDCIYIDPPYNTGNKHFVYKDNFGENSEWENFIRPRLEVSNELLKNDGVIFISIDDNEIGNLLVIMDSIYGRKNRLGIFCKEILGGKNDSKFIKRSHEYLVVYGKGKESLSTLRNNTKSQSETSVQQLNKWGDTDRRVDRPNLFYPIYVSIEKQKVSITPFKGAIKVLPIKSNGEEGRWRWGREKVEREIDRLIAKERGNGQIGVYVKSSASGGTSPWSSIISDFSNGGGSQIKEIFGDSKVFTYAKNLEYIKWIVSLVKNKNANFLDFFAGSGTLGQAVLELNKEDSGNRKFILCGNTEATAREPKKNICRDVCVERIKWSMKKLGIESNSGFDYFFINYTNKAIGKLSLNEVRSLAKVKYDLHLNLNMDLDRLMQMASSGFIYLGDNKDGKRFLLKNKKVKSIPNFFGKSAKIEIVEQHDLDSVQMPFNFEAREVA